MADDWEAEEFEERLRRAERVVVLFYADWCPFSRMFLPTFEREDAESSVPFARANLHDTADPRWAAHRVRVVPTVAYFEHGEELERLDGVARAGLSERGFSRFMDAVETLQERVVERHGRMQVDRFG